MSPARKSAWIIRGTLLIIVASTVAGCASTPLANSSRAEKATTSQEIDGSINPSPPEPNVWHVLRNTMADLHDAGIPIDYFFFVQAARVHSDCTMTTGAETCVVSSDAQHIRNIPERDSDVNDAILIAATEVTENVGRISFAGSIGRVTRFPCLRFCYLPRR